MIWSAIVIVSIFIASNYDVGDGLALILLFILTFTLVVIPVIFIFTAIVSIQSFKVKDYIWGIINVLLLILIVILGYWFLKSGNAGMVGI